MNPEIRTQPTFEVFYERIYKKIKLQTVHDYLNISCGLNDTSAKYSIQSMYFRMLACKIEGIDVQFNLPIIAEELRIKVASWKQFESTHLVNK